MFLLQQWITRLHFDQIQRHFISIESSWSALQFFFWVQVDITSGWPVNRRSVASPQDFDGICVDCSPFISRCQLSTCGRDECKPIVNCFCFLLASNRLADVAALQGREPSWVWQLRRWCAFPPVRCAACSCSESGRALLFLRVQIPTATQWRRRRRKRSPWKRLISKIDNFPTFRRLHTAHLHICKLIY